MPLSLYQARRQVLRFGVEKYILGSKIFVVSLGKILWAHKVLGHKKFTGALSLNAPHVYDPDVCNLT